MAVNVVNMVLALLACAAAFTLPFEVFLFSYAVLGPLHYLTQISWMHERNYFTAAGAKGNLQFLATMALCITALMFWLPEWSVAMPYVAFVAFGTALLMVLVEETRTKILGAVALLGLSLVMGRWAGFDLWFAGLLPSVVHVCVFTSCFVLVGALKSRDWTGGLLLLVYGACLAACFISGIDTSYSVSAGALERYTEDFYNLNIVLSEMFFEQPLASKAELFFGPHGLAVARFIAFCYTYHYLNWFSKTSVIRWHDVPRRRLVLCLVLWLLSLALYAYDYKVGLLSLAFLSVLHVYLEFPLNHQSFLTIGRELRALASGKNKP
ncbi:MAG: hypothetical protein ACI9EF_000728 [Pseudohongiellaceae bacterium]|jgi:hypothetical protein